MEITIENALRSLQDQTLTVMTAWQQGSIEAVHAFMKALGPLMPDLNLYHELPTFMQDMVGDPEQILESLFQFVVSILDLFKEFLLEIYRASMIAPRTPMVPKYIKP